MINKTQKQKMNLKKHNSMLVIQINKVILINKKIFNFLRSRISFCSKIKLKFKH